MPTHPIQPNCEHPVDRLTLSIEAARGMLPASSMPGTYICFEAAASGGFTCFLCACTCLEME